jgi:hypothetical protein
MSDSLIFAHMARNKKALAYVILSRARSGDVAAQMFLVKQKLARQAMLVRQSAEDSGRLA